MRPNSGKKIWWRCAEGHEWQQRVGHRSKGVGCPYCSNHQLLKGYNDLATTNPALAAEWNYEANGNMTPKDIIAGSERKVWWKCAHGHEWKATIVNRNKGTGCPYCTGREVLVGFNDLATTNLALAAEWNYEKNENLTPNDVTSRGHRCPYCSGRYAIKGVNDLQTVNPTLAKEWHKEKNGELTPMDVLPNSDKEAWWTCSNGHEWKTQIKARTRGTGCPYCSGKKVLAGHNDLETLKPNIAHEWHPTKNGELKPSMVSRGSHKNIWWLCECGREWQAKIYSRGNASGCPKCAKHKCKKRDT